MWTFNAFSVREIKNKDMVCHKASDSVKRTSDFSSISGCLLVVSSRPFPTQLALVLELVPVKILETLAAQQPVENDRSASISQISQRKRAFFLFQLKKKTAVQFLH